LRSNKSFVLEREHVSQSIGLNINRPVQIVSATGYLCKLGVIAVCEDKQGASRTTIFKPVVFRPVDLDQLAHTFSAQTRLMECATLLT